MNKRQRIWGKTWGHCAYCGGVLPDKGWHADHIDPLWRGRDDRGGRDDETNQVAACARCNRWKKTLTPDEFRNEIQAQFDRLYRDSPGFRLAVDFGVVRRSRIAVNFFMEQQETQHDQPRD